VTLDRAQWTSVAGPNFPSQQGLRGEILEAWRLCKLSFCDKRTRASEGGSLCLYFAQRVDTAAARSNQWPHLRTITAHNSWAAASPMHAVQSLQPLLLVARSGSCSAKPRDGHEPNDGPRQQRVANGATQPPAPLGTTLVAARGSRGDARGSGGLSLGEGWRVRKGIIGIVVAGALAVSGDLVASGLLFHHQLISSIFNSASSWTGYRVQVTIACPLNVFTIVVSSAERSCATMQQSKP
jgi:hypothetical protein